MNDYILFQFSIHKRLEAHGERARDRLVELARCCQRSRFARWLTALRASRHAPAPSCPSCA